MSVLQTVQKHFAARDISVSKTNIEANVRFVFNGGCLPEQLNIETRAWNPMCDEYAAMMIISNAEKAISKRIK